MLAAELLSHAMKVDFWGRCMGEWAQIAVGPNVGLTSELKFVDCDTFFGATSPPSGHFVSPIKPKAPCSCAWVC